MICARTAVPGFIEYVNVGRIRQTASNRRPRNQHDECPAEGQPRWLSLFVPLNPPFSIVSIFTGPAMSCRQS